MTESPSGTADGPPASTISVRPAGIGDHDDVVRIFLACWHTSYPQTLPHRLVAAMTDERANALWRRVLIEAGSGEVLLAVDRRSGLTLAVTRFGVTSTGDGTVQSLYVDPQAQGQGVGGHLLRYVIGRLEGRGAETVRLWVFRDNAPSRRFYARHGFTEDGAERVQQEFGEPEVRMTCDIRGRTGGKDLAAPDRPRQERST